MPMYVAGHERGVLPIGVWSTSSTRSMVSNPVTSVQPCQRCVTSNFARGASRDNTLERLRAGMSACAVLRARRVAGDDRTERPTASSRLVISTSRASVDLPEPLTPVMAIRRPSGMLAVTLRRLCSVAPCTVSQFSGVAARFAVAVFTSRRGLQRMLDRVRQILARERIRLRREIGHAALRDDRAAALARARPNVDDVIGAADRVLVVLDDHQRVALVAELLQRVEQDLVVARMQADGRFVQHVAHALQVAAELRGEADALRFAARQRRRGAIEAQVAKADFFEEQQAAFDFADHVAGDIGVAALELQLLDPAARCADRPAADFGDRLVVERHRARDFVQARAVRNPGTAGRRRRPVPVPPMESSARGRGRRRTITVSS